MQLIAIYITYPDQKSADTIARLLLDQKLIACANIIPAHSLYSWDGQIQNDAEFISLCKSIPEKWNDIKALISEYHPYDIPCIWKTDIESSDAYGTWVRESCT